MFRNGLYTVNTTEILSDGQDSSNAAKYLVTVTLDCGHEIFRGHFPGNPILPGVCQIGIIRELSEDILGYKLLLSQAGQVKYLSLINPLANPVLQFSLKYSPSANDETEVSAEIASSGSVFMKMKGRLKKFKQEFDV